MLKAKLKAALDSNDAQKLHQVLDEHRGSHAVRYVLEYLLSKGQTHTLYSVLDLLEEGQKSKGFPKTNWTKGKSK